MTRDKIRVKCRKCENLFVIAKDMFSPKVTDRPKAISHPTPISENTSIPGDTAGVSLVIESVANDTARLRIATKLMSLTGEKLSTVNQRLSKTPAVFHFQMSMTKADSLLKAIETRGAKAELVPGGSPARDTKARTKGRRQGRWKKWVILITSWTSPRARRNH
jgi:hypothetical protein